MTEGLVDIHLFAAARAAVGASVLSVASGTIAEILDRLAVEYPDFARVRPRCSVLVDEIVTHDLTAVVAPGSRLDILPPFAGG